MGGTVSVLSISVKPFRKYLQILIILNSVLASLLYIYLLGFFYTRCPQPFSIEINYTLNNTRFVRLNKIRDLGVMIDNELTFKQHRKNRKIII